MGFNSGLISEIRRFHFVVFLLLVVSEQEVFGTNVEMTEITVLQRLLIDK